MFKDYDRYLSTSLKVYIFVLVLIFILKLVGMDYFALAIDNPIMVKIANFIKSNIFINNFVLFFPLILNQYIVISFACNDNSKKMKIFNLIIIPFSCLLQGYKLNIFGNYSIIAEILYFYVVCLIYKKINKEKLEFKRLILIIVGLILLQATSALIRYKATLLYIKNPIANLILNLDYIMAMLIIYKLNFMKGECNKWTDGSQVEVGSSSLKKINLKQLLKRLQVNLHKFRLLPKEEKLSISIYIFLSLLWNTLSLVIILLVANLNHTFIECLFILTSFWLSKHAFGKPFHLPSMIQCFIVSNLTYYILNRITTPLGISIFIPILLGVGLSYVTSKLVKKTYKPLYRGMPKELFDETILKIVDKDSIKYKICYGFYINKKSDLSLSFEYNYSIAGIRKIKDRINDKIKGLN